ncbi:Interactor of constitutive active ROPs 2 [Gossypium australe]|uniref:Interactor of constitutive active ROPs 2 n=1 Tax=Gossypium australe TaxID=47621 RepID=A0A5B6VGC2_9ROSI|nr:Interactor of constitutive active ROPs 2 [Gossypium australe]
MIGCAMIQRNMNFSQSDPLFHLELKTREELESVLYHEELLWKQKVRCDWLSLRDCNTKFFHRHTLKRRSKIGLRL